MSSDTTSSSMATSTRQNMSAGPSPPASSATSSVKKPGQRSGKSTWAGQGRIRVGAGCARGGALAPLPAAGRPTRSVHSARSRAGAHALRAGVHGLRQACHSNSALSAGPVAGRLRSRIQMTTYDNALIPAAVTQGALHAAQSSRVLRWQSRSQGRPRQPSAPRQRPRAKHTAAATLQAGRTCTMQTRTCAILLRRNAGCWPGPAPAPRTHAITAAFTCAAGRAAVLRDRRPAGARRGTPVHQPCGAGLEQSRGCAHCAEGGGGGAGRTNWRSSGSSVSYRARSNCTARTAACSGALMRPLDCLIHVG